MVVIEYVGFCYVGVFGDVVELGGVEVVVGEDFVGGVED